MELLSRKDVPAEQIVTPEAYVAVPAMQNISYCMDNEELRNFIDKYEPKGESLKVKQVTRAEMMAVKAERQEDVKRIVKESKKRMSQKEADELFLNGGKVG